VRLAAALSMGLAVAGLLLGCSGGLEGERVEAPVADWSFVENADPVVFATAAGQRFRRVEARPLVHEGDLYLHAQTIFSANDPALDAILAGEPLEMQVDGRIYPLDAQHLTEAADIERVLPTLVRRGMRIEATGIRWDPKPARYPGTQVRQWFFRLRSSASGS
jgi:hypothetical protein